MHHNRRASVTSTSVIHIGAAAAQRRWQPSAAAQTHPGGLCIAAPEQQQSYAKWTRPILVNNAGAVAQHLMRITCTAARSISTAHTAGVPPMQLHTRAASSPQMTCRSSQKKIHASYYTVYSQYKADCMWSPAISSHTGHIIRQSCSAKHAT